MNMFNLQAEREVLGVVLNDDINLERVINEVIDEDFYDKKHRLIYLYMKEVFIKGEKINIVTLSNHIGEKGIMEVGGVSYLSSLRETYTNFRLENHLRIIKELAEKRKLVGSLKKSINKINNGEKDVDKVREEVYKSLEKRDSSKNRVIKEKELMANVLDEIEKRFLNGGDILGMKTGYKNLDITLNGLKRGELVVLAGRPAMGKTVTAINILDGLAENGYKVLLDELEMTEDSVGLRIISKNTMIKHSKIQNGRLEEADFCKIIAESDRMAKRGNLSLDCSPNQSLATIAAKAKTLKQTSGLDVLVIDYIGLMDVKVKDTRTNAIGDLTRGLKLLAKELDINIIILCQLSRGVELRSEKRPLLSDLRDSGSIEQDADVVIFTYRKNYYDREKKKEATEKETIELIIAKNRSGKCGLIKQDFYPEYQKIA